MATSEDCCDIYPIDDFQKDSDATLENIDKYETELSMYDTHSPSRMSCDGSPSNDQFLIDHHLDDLDPCSQDSGYSACESSKTSLRERGMSFGSSDDEPLDLSELEQERNSINDDTRQLSGHLNKLFTGTLIKKPMKQPSPDCMVMARPAFRRALSMISPNTSTTPNSSKARSCLFKSTGKSSDQDICAIENMDQKIPSFLLESDMEVRAFKRPEPPTELISPMSFKRSRGAIIERIPARPILQRSMSATEDRIKLAVQRSSSEPDLIGDFSKPYCLPIVQGRHQDLKSITPDTLADLLRGSYEHCVSSFQVLDCRYPYEYEGGHIAGANNVYTKQQVLDDLLNKKISNPMMPSEDGKRQIIIFHCEFSSERAPNLSRYLRNIDRSQNKDVYPYLHFPEIYLLDGGYKSFHSVHSELCAPNGYLPMNHPDHEHNLRHFRAKSKTWNCDSRSKLILRSATFKRI